MGKALKRNEPVSQRRHSGVIPVVVVLILAQYILAFFFNLPGWKPLQWVGWAIWVLSLVFGIAPIFILRQKGGVAKGKSYVETTHLVDTSMYAIVRHPQYLIKDEEALMKREFGLEWQTYCKKP